MGDQTLDPILFATRWVRIIFVRGIAALGQVCDPRSNSGLCNKRSDARWRSPNNRFSIVSFKCDEQDMDPANAMLWRSLFGTYHQTLVYNYQDMTVATLAELLLDLYDNKLQRKLPPCCWYGLDPDETQSLYHMERTEFAVTQYALLPPALTAVLNKTVLISNDQDQTPITLQEICAAPICLAAAAANPTIACIVCNRSFCTLECLDFHEC